MKTVIFLAALFVIVKCSYITDVRENCIKKFALTQDEIDHVKETKDASEVTNPKSIEVAKCATEGSGMLKTDGTIDANTVKDMAKMLSGSKEVAEKVKNKCSSIKGDSQDDTANQLWYCFLTTNGFTKNKQ